MTLNWKPKYLYLNLNWNKIKSFICILLKQLLIIFSDSLLSIMAGCCENWFSLLNVFGFYFKFIFIIQILCSNWRQKDTPITYHHYAKVLSISYIYIFFFFFLIHRLPTKVGDPHGNHCPRYSGPENIYRWASQPYS